MTKYEWETELKKNIHRLPAAEIKRVLEYYDELFADKIERGKGEMEIINEFGNPVDVADKILSDYDGELMEEAPTVTPPTAESSEPKADEAPTPAPASEKEEDRAESKEDGNVGESKEKAQGELRMGRLIAFVIINALTGFTLFIAVAVVWIIAISCVAGVASMLLGGAFGSIESLIVMFGGSFGSGVAQLGMCIALLGVGILLAVLMDKVIIWLGKSTAKFFKWLKNWLTARRKTYEKS